MAGDPFQEIAVVYWPLLASEVTGVAPATGAVMTTFAVEMVVAGIAEPVTVPVPVK